MKTALGIFLLLVIVGAIFGGASHSSAPTVSVTTRAPAATVDDCWGEMIDLSNAEALGRSYDGLGCTDEALRQLNYGTR